MNSETGMGLVYHFFAGTGSTYDQTVKRWTLGLDGWWKSAIIRRIPLQPVRILDQACGTGILSFRMAQRYPRCRIIGVDLQEEYLLCARKKQKMLRLDTVDFVLGRAEEICLRLDFDCITSSYLAKYADLPALVKNARNMLKQNGVLIMHDFTYPSNAWSAQALECYFKLMQSLGKRWHYPEWHTIFRELPDLIRSTRWVGELLAALQAHAFEDIAVTPLTFGASTIVTARNVKPL